MDTTEARRLDVLRHYNILDTPPDKVFDRIASVAANHFQAPMAIVSFIDETRQWFKAAYGLEDLRQTPREIAFCLHTIAQQGVFVVPNALDDPRFVDNPLVCMPPDLRFYAGAPIRTREGAALGSVAVLDRVPRGPVSKADQDFLHFLADTVVHELEIRLAAADLQAEIERRQRSEQRLQLAVAHAPITLASLDADLRYTWVVNPPPPLKPEDFLGKTNLDLWPGELGEAMQSIKRQVMVGRGRRRIDVSIPIAGVIRDYDITLDPIFDRGQFTGISYAAVDVTERKRAERTLAETEARHRAVLETAVDAIVVTDEHGLIHHFNKSATRIFGYTEEEVLGRNVSMLMPEPHRSAHDSYIRHYLDTGETKIMGVGRELDGLRKDGTLVPLDLQIGEWRLGLMRMFTGTMRDISLRRAREEALHRAEDARAQTLALLNAMMESIPDALFYKDLDGRYIVANAATARVLGVEGVVGKTDEELFPSSVARRLREFDARVIAEGTPLIMEGQHYEQGLGPPRWFVTTKSPLRDASGAIIGVVGLARDITERRQMVDELKDARDQAEAANRAKSTFLAAASHDLRQPAQALVLFTSALEARLGNHPASEIVGRMRQSLEALQSLLEALLDVSRLDAGVVDVSRERVLMADVLDQMLEDFRGLAEEKGLRFTSVRCRYWTETDPKLLVRVVRNLLDNALKYTEKGGILIGGRRRGDQLLLQVRDTGIGIPHEQIETVFHEFVQLHNVARDRTKGLGLGLAIVRRLLALLGHKLEVTSHPGHGTCFSIVLPLLADHRTESLLPCPVATPEQSRCQKHVLVIEDEEMVRRGLEVLMGGWGCDVLTAADEKEALALVTCEGVPDFIIADYRLRGGRLGTDAVRGSSRPAGELSQP